MPELEVFSLVIAADRHTEQHFRDHFISIPDCAPLQSCEMAPQSPEHFMNLFLHFFLCESRSPERGQPNWHWKLFISTQGNNSLQCLYSQFWRPVLVASSGKKWIFLARELPSELNLPLYLITSAMVSFFSVMNSTLTLFCSLSEISTTFQTYSRTQIHCPFAKTQAAHSLALQGV